jgi:tRNA 2-thiouridine synthesizing protein C
MTQKMFLIVCRRPPYGESFAREALDVAMAAAAFDQQVAMLFLGDGVTQLRAQQESGEIMQKSLQKQLSALPLYDVTDIYVDAEALSERGLNTSALSLPAKPLDRYDIAALLARCDIALNF